MSGSTTLGPLGPQGQSCALWLPLPFDATELGEGGRLGAWQVVNAHSTIPHCIDQLEASGTIDNFRRALGKSDAPFVGMWFADSDLYKTLEAVAWEQGRGGADRTAYVTEMTELLAAVQRSDGYLNSWYQVEKPQAVFDELRDGHELYCLGHLIQAAVAWQRATGATELLDVARRFADLVVARFGAGGAEGYCGHPQIESALVELYRATGQQDYLDLARRMIDLRGKGELANDHSGPRYYQDHEPVRTADEATGHAVRQIYLATGAADVYLETGDEEMLAYCLRIWESAHATKMYVTGGFGARHRDESFGDAYELPAERAYAETCAGIANVLWNWRLLVATGQSRFADELERSLYNAVAVGVSRHGDAFFYSNPLQVRTTHAEDKDWNSFVHRVPWFDCACCPPNLGRLIASLHHYVATRSGDELQVHLYADADIQAGATDDLVRMRTGYPWDGGVRIDVPAATGLTAIRLRVPGWTTRRSLRLDGEFVPAPVVDGYLVVALPSDGASIELDLDMPVEIVAPHPHVDAVRGSRAVRRGPVVYALEAVDLPDGVLLEDVRLDERAPIQLSDEVTGLDVPVTLLARGVVVPAAGHPLYGADPAEHTDPAPAEEIELRLVPYYRWGNRGTGAMRVWIPQVTA